MMHKKKFPINTIIQGGCLEVMPDLPDRCVDLIVIDPPYLLTSESWDQEEVVSEELSQELFRIAKPSCSLYCWCSIGGKIPSLIRWFPVFSKLWSYQDLITWKKQRGHGMRKGWLYTREEIMWFVKDNKQYTWNKEFQYGNEKRAFTLPNSISEYRRFSNIWTDIKEINQAIAKNTEVAMHPSQKPQKAIERIILAHTKENDVVFDCFVGSGTTCVAAKRTGRKYIGIEISKKYCELSRNRLKQTSRETNLL